MACLDTYLFQFWNSSRLGNCVLECPNCSVLRYFSCSFFLIFLAGKNADFERSCLAGETVRCCWRRTGKFSFCEYQLWPHFCWILSNSHDYLFCDLPRPRGKSSTVMRPPPITGTSSSPSGFLPRMVYVRFSSRRSRQKILNFDWFLVPDPVLVNWKILKVNNSHSEFLQFFVWTFLHKNLIFCADAFVIPVSLGILFPRYSVLLSQFLLLPGSCHSFSDYFHVVFILWTKTASYSHTL